MHAIFTSYTTNGLLNEFPWNIDITFQNNVAVADNEFIFEGAFMNGNLVLPEGVETFKVYDNKQTAGGDGQYHFNGRVTFPNTIKNLDYAFANAPIFNQPLDIPDGDINCAYMFGLFHHGYNAPVNIGNGAKNVTNMFYQCPGINSPVTIGNGVTNFDFMFWNCINYNKPFNLPDSAESARSMFYRCLNLNSTVNLGNGLRNASAMFDVCAKFDQPVTLPATLEYCGSMFQSCVGFNKPVTIPGNVTSMVGMFNGARTLNQPVTVPNIDINMNAAFQNCKNLCQNMTIPQAITNKYRIAQTFKDCTGFDSTKAQINVPSHFYGTDAVTYWDQTARACINWY